MTEIIIGRRKIGPGHPCFIIAEAGVNHNGDPELAFQLVDAAVAAGADAVKFQTWKTENLVTPLSPKAEYQLRTTEAAETQFEMLKKLELPPGTFADLKKHCEQRGIMFLSTPADEDSADLLESLDVAAFKIGSAELTNVPFLRHVAQKGRPLIVSTGMGTLEEVVKAAEAIFATGNQQLALLHCVSNYPAAPETVNLKAMSTIAEQVGVPVGFSDHTEGIVVSVAAVALGACILEKHFTLGRTLPGPDHVASVTPQDLGKLVQAIRTAEAALGDGIKRPAACEKNTAEVARRSLVAAMDLPAGTVLSKRNISVKRPGTGLPPSAISEVFGRKLRVAVTAGVPLTKEMLE